MSSNERTGWRDQWISERHRDWGRDTPVVNIDCLLLKEGEMDQAWCEFDRREPVAIIEYKNRRARLDSGDANNTTLRRLADRANLPFLIVVYDTDQVQFGVVPMNSQAKEFVAEKQILSEEKYVELLYRLRKRVMPEDIRLQLLH